jgi:hypothetical protein
MCVSNSDGDREMMANVYVRRLDEMAASEGCDLPVSLLIAIVKLFGEALDSRFEATAPAGARYEFTRCGAIDDAALVATSHCVRRRGHVGEHFAAGGERWADEAIAGGKHVDVRRPIELLCFAGCGATATHGRFCRNHRADG